MLCTCRVFAVMLLFTPLLGLFNTLHHGRLAALSVKQDRNGEPFDHGLNVTLHEAWEQFRIDTSSDFVELPATAVVAIMISMFILHIFVISCTLKITLNGKKTVTLLPQGFYSIISPPLHLDWEFFYRQSNMKDSISKCWKRQVRGFYQY